MHTGSAPCWRTCAAYAKTKTTIENKEFSLPNTIPSPTRLAAGKPIEQLYKISFPAWARTTIF
ncbi:hypothetical protein D0C36_17465 [Mucilaginibacter conchicola]|uniref:Uncharacterized protein n=1 Tax=Mucilaginibacter conchicola TaxID=2303333 RepID=A0A372NP73_9SPHI|nr:hypothetical protein D0C36_17465 [Mucilaginibacter conchicola]